jgi:hypothetical protein
MLRVMFAFGLAAALRHQGREDRSRAFAMLNGR